MRQMRLGSCDHIREEGDSVRPWPQRNRRPLINRMERVNEQVGAALSGNPAATKRSQRSRYDIGFKGADGNPACVSQC